MHRSLLLLCCPCLAISAQPVLQYANLVPLGTSNAIHVMIDPGISDPSANGANLTWDFSSATVQLNVGTMSWVAPSATPFGSSYPTSNLAQTISIPSGTTYNYFNLQSTQLDQLADGVGGTGVSIYADTKTILVFPLNYQDSYVDNFTDNGTPASYTRTYAGYGTVILPTGTYTNVVKMISTSGAIDFLLSNPVSQLVHIEDDGSVLLFGDPVSPVAEHVGATSLQGFPNPATDRLSVTGVRSAGTWEIVDAEGRLQRQGQATPGLLTLPMEGLAPGCYAFVLHDAKGSHALRVVKQ